GRAAGPGRARRRLLRPGALHPRDPALLGDDAGGAAPAALKCRIRTIASGARAARCPPGEDTMTTTPDIFTNVHKGLRRALFEGCVALGRGGDGREESAPARRLLQEAMHFVRHHGANEDLLLLPLLRARAPEVAARMDEAHRRLEGAIGELDAHVEEEPVPAL